MYLPEAAQSEVAKFYDKRSHVELSIGILKNGVSETVHYGPNGEIVEGNELVYPVGSICKPFTASLAAKYIDEGKLSLDEHIDEYISGLPEQYYPTLRRLATHTSGYRSQPYTALSALPLVIRMNRENGMFHVNPFRGNPDEEGMRKILAETHLKNMQYKFVYSNFGMSVLGYIAGQETGEGFWDGMNRYIKEDLGLEHTFLGNTDLTGYDRKENECRCWQWEKEDIIAPAGALNATMSDLLEFAKINMDGSHPYLAMCHSIHGPCEKNANSGLAWRLEKDVPVSWHTGSAGAFSAWLGMNRQTKTAVAVGVNYGLVNAEDLGFAILRNEREIR